MFRYIVVAIFGILASVSVAMDKDDIESLHAYMQDTKAKCMTEFGINEDDFKDMKKNNEFDKIDSCFIACIMKEKKVIDDKGMFNLKEANEIAEKFITDPEMLEKVKKMGEDCESVNEADVSDGEKGCERAELMMQCLMEKGGKGM